MSPTVTLLLLPPRLLRAKLFAPVCVFHSTRNITACAITMPPKRKAKSPAADEEEHTTKKSRVEQETETAQPTNKVLPVDIKFTPRVNGRLRLSTWNIAGWSASQKKVSESFYTVWAISTQSDRVSSITLRRRTRIYLCSPNLR